MKLFRKTQERMKRASNVNLLVEQVSFIKRMALGVFRIPRSDRADQFENLGNLGITDQKISDAAKAFQRAYKFFLALALIIFVYGIYHLWKGNFFASVISAGVLLVCLSQSFKYHFWLMQIRKKKLGCTFSDWTAYVFKRSK